MRFAYLCVYFISRAEGKRGGQWTSFTERTACGPSLLSVRPRATLAIQTGRVAMRTYMCIVT